MFAGCCDETSSGKSSSLPEGVGLRKLSDIPYIVSEEKYANIETGRLRLLVNRRFSYI